MHFEGRSILLQSYIIIHYERYHLGNEQGWCASLLCFTKPVLSFELPKTYDTSTTITPPLSAGEYYCAVRLTNNVHICGILWSLKKIRTYPLLFTTKWKHYSSWRKTRYKSPGYTRYSSYDDMYTFTNTEKLCSGGKICFRLIIKGLSCLQGFIG